MSNMRIGGLASGMDIDSIVRDLMSVERMKVDKVTQDKTHLEWTREAYNDVNKMFADFVLNTRQSFGLTMTSGGVINNKSVSSLDWIKSATIDDSSIADVTARSNAINGSYKVNVVNLASNWSAASSENISIGDKANLASQFDLADEDTINFTITTNAGSENEKSVIINETNLESLSLKDIVKQINNADIGVTAIYDESIDRFFLQTNETGDKNTIKIEDGSGFISKLKLNDGQQGVLDTGNLFEGHGIDALIHFGAAKNISQSSNQFTINNIDFDIKTTGETIVKVGTDENGIIDKVNEFVDQYNELIDNIDKMLNEKQYRDFRPLTDEQRKAMSDKEVEQWEEKAKSGLLRNDQIINRTMQSIRSGLYEEVVGVMGSISHLTHIGIETESYVSGSMGGKLKVNEEKLRNALREDVNGVLDILFKEADSSITDSKEKRLSTGLIGRMYGDMVVGMKEVIAKAGPGEDSVLYRKINSTMLIDFVTKHSSISMLDKNIMSYEKRVLELERRLIEKENSYWKKFTAMEKALNNMYSQSDWLAQQLAGGQMY
jgi:flagellar hook-associated protein 2